MSKLILTDSKTVLFISFHGRGCSDNPKAIYEYMINNDEFNGYNLIWILKKDVRCDLKEAKVVNYLSLKYFYYLCRSKYWISNCKLPEYLTKKENQIYLQTWHGTPLKKLAHDIDVSKETTFYRSGLSLEQMRCTYDKDVKRYNYMISPNSFTTKVFQSAFLIDKHKLIETGYPRNDILTTFTKEDVINIKDKYGIPIDKKIILYAPTWRDNSYDFNGYTFKLEVDFKKWRDGLGDEYIILFKPHYLIVNNLDLSSFNDFVYPINANVDISDLYIISDVLVTDYSSVFFDYAILNRPIYFYMYDLISYKNELRGFYLDIHKDLPGKVIEEEDKLIDLIKNEKFDFNKLDVFNTIFNNKEDGHATARVVDIVLNRR